MCKPVLFKQGPGGGDDKNYKSCIQAADGTHEDWNSFCSTIPPIVKNNVVGGGSAQQACFSKTYDPPAKKKKNWCYNQFGKPQ